MKRAEWVFEGDRSAEAALAALRAGSLSLRGMYRRPGVRTKIRPGGRLVMTYSRPMVGNGWRPVFAGKLESHGSAHRIHGRFRMSRPTRAFMALWFGILVVVVVGGAAAGALKLAQGTPDYELFLVPVFGSGMMLMGAAMTVAFRYGMGERDELAIVDHIQELCNARVVERPDDTRVAATARVLWSKLTGVSRSAPWW